MSTAVRRTQSGSSGELGSWVQAQGPRVPGQKPGGRSRVGYAHGTGSESTYKRIVGNGWDTVGEPSWSRAEREDPQRSLEKRRHLLRAEGPDSEGHGGRGGRGERGSCGPGLGLTCFRPSHPEYPVNISRTDGRRGTGLWVQDALSHHPRSRPFAALHAQGPGSSPSCAPAARPVCLEPTAQGALSLTAASPAARL